MLGKIKSQIPNSITCTSLIFGSLATIASFHFTEEVWGMPAFMWAFVCIGIAAVCDFLDGASARLLHAYSAMGKELDSLSDLVSFGVAPGMLVYNMVLTLGGAHWAALMALLIPVMGELRLARFNIDDRQTTSFLGMPIPANALFWIGFTAWTMEHGYVGDVAMAAIIVVMASTMVMMKMKMFSLKFKNFAWRENVRRYVILIAAAVFITSEGLAGLAWTIIFYIVLSLLPERRVAE